MTYIYVHRDTVFLTTGKYLENMSSVLGQNTFKHPQESQFRPGNHQNQFTWVPDWSSELWTRSWGSESRTAQQNSNQSDPGSVPTSVSNAEERETDPTTDQAEGSKDSQMSVEDPKDNQEAGISVKDGGDGKEESQGHSLQKPKY